MCVESLLVSLHPISAFAWYVTLHYASRCVVHKLGSVRVWVLIRCVLVHPLAAAVHLFSTTLSECFPSTNFHHIVGHSFLHCDCSDDTDVVSTIPSYTQTQIAARFVYLKIGMITWPPAFFTLTCDLAPAQNNSAAAAAWLVGFISMQRICTGEE